MQRMTSSNHSPERDSEAPWKPPTDPLKRRERAGPCHGQCRVRTPVRARPKISVHNVNRIGLELRSTLEHNILMPDREKALTLEILSAIDARSDVTQRHLADRLGVALGLANSYLRRCVRKGLVKITQAPANRYLYYLTPQGFAEKSRLTAEYLSASFDFYRRAGASVGQALQACAARGERRIVLAGVSELAEIATIRSHDLGVEILGIFAPDAQSGTHLGKPVWCTVPELPAFDAVVLTALERPQALLAALAETMPRDRVIVPDLLQTLFDGPVARTPPAVTLPDTP